MNFSSVSSNIPILEESMILRYRLLNEIKDKNFDIFNNLSMKQLIVLTYLMKYKPFKIMDCDKNLGVSFTSGSGSYVEIIENPLENLVSDINHNLILLYHGKNISKQMMNNVFIKGLCKLGSFRVLSKLPKEKFGIRPIVNCSGQPPEKLCIVLDNLFTPILRQISYILKDSQQILQRFENLFSHKKPYLYSLDFKSLYTSILQGHAIEIICDFMKD
ncbi:unnamed protein product [Brachionus calyciflorus]|uniref:Reverse transcriptase domain-containing protein n=1 Tax=Brachionus calyciflorus TaxID=104777 RepID=A0A813TCD7_9BILA|nr:unnamed protein product [Brachionus calyciflorus]